MTDPRVTVILPVHNGLPFLPAALESILSQTLRDFVVIAIDDGSTDGSGDYLDSVKDKRVTVIHRSQAGLGAVLNYGLRLCATPFVARMDADDISLPERFDRQVACLLRDPALVAVGSPLVFLVHKTQQKGLRYPTTHEAIVRDLLRGESSFSHPTLMMRTDAARATGYRISGAGEDLDFCLRLGEYGRIANLETPHYLYRLHAQSVSLTKQGELECGYAYARHTALQRMRQQAETPFAEFSSAWKLRGFTSRVRSRMASTSYARYRKARLAWAEQAYFQSAVHLSLSLALQPVKAAGVLARKARPLFTTPREVQTSLELRPAPAEAAAESTFSPLQSSKL